MTIERGLAWLLFAVLAAACARASRQGSTPDGRPIWRIECPPAGGCDQKALKVCKGEYAPISDGDSYDVFTNSYTGDTTVSRQRNMLVVCLGRRRGEATQEATLEREEPNTEPLAPRAPEDPWREKPSALEDPWQASEQLPP